MKPTTRRVIYAIILILFVFGTVAISFAPLLYGY